MATETKAAAASGDNEKPGKAPGEGITPSQDATGTVSNTNDGAGTRQLEPKPEELPASSKVTPPEVQANSRMSRAVGDLIGDTNATRTALDNASDAHAEQTDKVYETATDLIAKKRDIDKQLS